MSRIERIIFPKNSFRRKVVKRALIGLGLRSPVVAGYYNTLFQQGHRIISPAKVYTGKRTPLISIIVPAYNTKQRYLGELIFSLMSQTYPHWELILVNASTDEERARAINLISEKDTRIRTIRVKNKGISSNTNIGIQHSKGEYIAFSDHDDTLDPSALQDVAQSIADYGAEVVYTDEDKLSDNGEIYYDPHYKPGWNPDLFTHVNYVNHFTVVKKTIIDNVGPLNTKRDGAQDYDFMLRVFDTDPRVIHIPKVLYHWRAAEGSTARDFSLKKSVTDAGVAALKDHFDRIGMKVKVVPKKNRPGFYHLGFPNYKNISIIVLPFLSDATLRLYNEILIRQTNFRQGVTLIVPEGTAPRFDTENLTVSVIERAPDYIRRALGAAESDVTVCINSIAFPTSRDWLRELTSNLRRHHVCAVSPVTLLDDTIIDNCGLIQHQGNYLPLYRNQRAKENQTIFGNTDWVRDVDRLKGDIIAVRTDELKRFVDGSKTNDYGDLIVEYQLSDRYKLVDPGVAFSRRGIRLAPAIQEEGAFFNSNIDPYGDEYLIYTPEAAILNIMMSLAEDEGIDL